MKNKSKILSICLGLVLALGVTGCDEISDLLDEGGGDGDTTETDTSGEDSGDTSSDGSEQEKEEDKVLVTSLTFDASSYSLEVGGSTPYSVSVEPSNATNQDYSISFINESGEEDITIACEKDGYIYGLKEGNVMVVATALDGSGVTGSASVEVTPLPNPVTDISFDHTSTSVYEEVSFTIGPSDSNADIKVNVTPSDADDTSWTISTNSEYLSISGPDTYGVYTVTASESSGGSTASIIVTSTATSLTATLTVVILETGTTYVPVTSISVDPTELTLSVGESVVIGSESGEGIDAVVSIEPTDATLPTYTVSIPEDAAPYLELETTDGVTTITAKEGADNRDFIVTITPDDSEYTGEGATLTLHVSKNASVLTEISVSGTDSLTVATEGELDLSNLTVTGTDQYGETMEVESWSLTLEAGETDAELEDTTLKVGFIPGEVTLKVVVDGVDPIEFKVTITQGTIHPTDISISQTEFEIYTGDTIDLKDYVTVTADTGANETGYEATSSDGYVSISDTIITGVSEGTATVSIVLKDATRCDKTLTISITVKAIPSDTLTNYTLSFTYTGTIPNDEQLAIVGDWMEGVSEDNMDLSKSVPLEDDSITLESIGNGVTLHYELLIGYTNTNAPWYTQKVIYTGSVVTAPNNDGYKVSDYSDIAVSVNTGVDVSTALASVGENTNYTVALEDTGDMGTSWPGKDKDGNDISGAFYIEGTDGLWTEEHKEGNDTDGYRATQTMSSYTGDEYDYDFYFDFDSIYGASKIGFAIAPDEWYSNMYSNGIGPVSGLEIILGTDASDGTPYLKYTTFKRDSGENWSTGQWEFDFWQLAVDAGYDSTDETTITNTWDLNPFQFITDMTIVLQLDLSSTGYETWNEVDTITGFYFIVNGNVVSAVSCPAES